MPHLSLLPRPNPTSRARQDANSDPAKLVGCMLDEPQREAQRRLDAIKARRDFRLIHGGRS